VGLERLIHDVCGRVELLDVRCRGKAGKVHLVRNAHGRDRHLLDHYLTLERSERTAAVVAEVRGLLDAYGSIEFAAAYARGIAGAALDAFEEAFTPAMSGPDREFVRALVPYMLDRRA
jgi:geranylgeranyl diphosphate synthase type II